MASRFWVGGTGTWDQTSTTHWSSSTGGGSGAAVPTASDDVFFDAGSGTGTVTVSINAPCNSLNSANSTLHTLQLNTNIILTIGSSVAGSGSVALDFSGFTTTFFNPGSAISFISTSATVQTIKTGGNTMPPTTINGLGSSYQLATAYTCSSVVTLTAGALDCNGQTCAWFAFVSTGTSTRSITLGTATITLNSSSGQAPWLVTTSGMTVSAASGTLSFTNLGSAASQAITLNTFTYGTIKMSGTAANAVIFASTVTIGSLQMTGPLLVKVNSGTTKTLTNFWARGSSGNLVTFQSGTGGTQYTFSKTSGTVQLEWVSLQDANATGGATFVVGNGTNVLNNTGWTFSDPAALTGASSFSGLSNQTTTHSAAATGSFSGSSKQQTTTVRNGVATFTGSSSQSTSRNLGATALSFAGSMLKQLNRALAGSLGFSGSVAKLRGAVFAAVLSFSGALPWSIVYTMLASLGLSGSTANQTRIPIAGVLSFAGAQVRQAIKALSGTASFSGANVRRVFKALTPSLSFTGFIAEHTGIVRLTAVLAPSGTVVAIFLHPFVAALSFTGGFARQTFAPLLASLLPSGNLGIKWLIKNLIAHLNTSGAFIRSTAMPLAGVLTSAASRVTPLHTLLTASLSPAGLIGRQLPIDLAASLAFIGNMFKQALPGVYHAALSFTGSFGTGSAGLIIKNLAATLLGSTFPGLNVFPPLIPGSPSSTLLKAVGKGVPASLPLSGDFTRALARTLASAALGLTGAVSKQLRRTLTAASLGLSGAIAKLSRPGSLTAALTSTGAVAKTTLKRFVASLSPGAILRRLFGKALTAALPPSGTLSRALRRALTASQGFSGNVPRFFPRTLTGAVAFVGSTPKTVRRAFAGALPSSGAIIRKRLAQLTAALTPSGVLARLQTRTLTAALSFTTVIPSTLGQALLRIYQIVKTALIQTGPTTAPTTMTQYVYVTEDRTSGDYVLAEDPDSGVITIYRG